MQLCKLVGLRRVVVAAMARHGPHGVARLKERLNGSGGEIKGFSNHDGCARSTEDRWNSEQKRPHPARKLEVSNSVDLRQQVFQFASGSLGESQTNPRERRKK
jgi:hypothetical protein